MLNLLPNLIIINSLFSVSGTIDQSAGAKTMCPKKIDPPTHIEEHVI